MTTALSVKSGKVWCEQSPIHATEGETRKFTVTHLDAAAVATPVVKAYANKRDVTSVVFPTNSPAASANTITLSNMTAMIGGNRYVVTVSAVVDSVDTVIAKFQVICQRARQEH